ncbi:V-type ATPase subunit [bacterium]|nr:V-type ATPase subunit [bacterium]
MLFQPIITTGDTRYAYASGVIRAKETRLLRKADFYKLAEIPTDELGKAFEEAGYYLKNSENPSIEDYEAGLADAERETLNLIDELLPNSRLPFCLKAKYDFTNAAYLLKCQISGEKPKDAGIVHIGNLSATRLRRLFTAGEKEKIPVEFIHSIEQAKQEYEATKNPATIDITLDKEYLSLLKNCLEGNRFIKEYIGLKSDLLNIKNFVRTRLLKLPYGFFKTVFVPFGKLALNYFDELSDKQEEAIPTKLSVSYLGRRLGDELARAINEKEFLDFDVLCEAYELLFLDNTKFCPFGLEIVYAYWEKITLEITTIRRIILARLSGLPEERIRRIIPYGYL